MLLTSLAKPLSDFRLQAVFTHSHHSGQQAHNPLKTHNSNPAMNITELTQTDTLKFTEDTDFFNNPHLETEESDLNLLEGELVEPKNDLVVSRSSGYSKTSSDDT